MNKIKKIFLPVGLLCLFFYSANSQGLSKLPVVVKKDAVSQLYVDGKPFLILGGETGNASVSSTDYMRPC
ncbi:MAG TPA: hypothetical protein VKI61_06115 [Chitinophagaceae bacterium]|jgi:hypothetical protein|nr:hypothetical protein [Chitinophagaceae bacterium]